MALNKHIELTALSPMAPMSMHYAPSANAKSESGVNDLWRGIKLFPRIITI